MHVRNREDFSPPTPLSLTVRPRSFFLEPTTVPANLGDGHRRRTRPSRDLRGVAWRGACSRALASRTSARTATAAARKGAMQPTSAARATAWAAQLRPGARKYRKLMRLVHPDALVSLGPRSDDGSGAGHVRGAAPDLRRRVDDHGAAERDRRRGPRARATAVSRHPWGLSPGGPPR